MLRRSLPIGIEFYTDMIDRNYYYVDKTLIIRDFLNTDAKVNFFYASAPVREDVESDRGRYGREARA